MNSKVYLGFEDEFISECSQSLVNYMTNKIGGKPDWIENNAVTETKCQLCGMIRPLIVQIYAPLENSQYHRTLYIFGCVNPKCWNQKESWLCLRSQILDIKSEKCDSVVEMFDWCDGANNWEDEENGNFIRETSNKQEFANEQENLINSMAELDFEECTEISSAGSMSQQLTSPIATAEIEGEDEVVTIDTPSLAQTDVPALFGQVKPVPQVLSETLQFNSFFVSVIEEQETQQFSSIKSDLSDCCMATDEESNSSMTNKGVKMEVTNGESTEKYEKTLPLHGDKLFHRFISRIQRNPGHILRYIRDGGTPLFLYPEKDLPKSCQHCHGDLIFEVQLLPTLITRLHLVGSGTGHIEFGTVFVLACKQSCWTQKNTVLSEYVIVQREM